MKRFCVIFFIRTLLADSSFVQLEVDSSQVCIKNVLKNETENGGKILLGKYICRRTLYMKSNFHFLVEDYIENKRFPEKMQFFQEYPIRSQTGEIFTQPDMIEYTVELKSDDVVHFKEGFIV